MAVDTTRDPGTSREPEVALERPASRRKLLATGVSGMLGLMLGSLGRPGKADAAAGSPLVMGSANSAGTSNTSLSTASSGTALLVTQTGAGTALRGSATAVNGIAGFFTSANGPGVSGVTANKDKFGVYAGHDSAAKGTGAALRADGKLNDGIVSTTSGASSHAISASNTSATGVGTLSVGVKVGLFGATTAGLVGPTYNYGVLGATDAAEGRGVWGVSRAATGANTFAVKGDSSSVTAGAAGVYGLSTPATGLGSGVIGESSSAQGRGVWGRVYSTGAVSYSVLGENASNQGYGVLGYATSATGTCYGIVGWCASPSGWAGSFVNGTGNGVSIVAASGKTGLVVSGGSKSAAVPTKQGMRLLYSEEATGVYFADYGFGKLSGGVAAVDIDSLFAETVNLSKPYFVFVEAYGDTSLYVTNRTTTGFTVRGRDGDKAADFAYRIVGVRKGFEGKRLEPTSMPAHVAPKTSSHTAPKAG